MGATHDAIEAIVAREDLTPGEKRRLIRRRRGRALREHIQSIALPRSFDLRGQRTITVERIELAPEDDAIKLTVSWTHQGKAMPFSNPWVIVNPPLLVPDEAGEVSRTDEDGTGTVRRYRENVRDAFLAVCDQVFR